MKRILSYYLIITALISTLPTFGQCGGDLTPPDPQIVDSLSFDIATGDLIIGWQENPAGDACWYYIFYKNPITGSNDIIDSVPANVSGNYTYNISSNNAQTQIESYAIGVKDCCNNQMFTILDYHSSILLSGTLDKCDTSVTLNWNAYEWFNSGTNVQYQIYVSSNGNPFALLGTTTNTTFTHRPVGDNSSNIYYIRAIENGGAGPATSTSSPFSININLLNPVSFLDLYTVSVKDSNTITVTFIPDLNAGTKKYYIKRAFAESYVFTNITEVPYTNFSQVTVFDNTAEPTKYRYKYEVWSEDSCGKFSKKSNLGTNILLEIKKDNLTLTNTLTWNSYRNWLGGVNQYNIYRAEDSPNNPFSLIYTEFITSEPNSDTLYVFDDILDNDVLEGNGKFCYYIEAEENNVNHYGVANFARSYSNIVCVDVSPIIYVPNAFNPRSEESKNRVFRPVISLFNQTTFVMKIYDRWGHVIFETDDYYEGWNGYRKPGKLYETGVYSYQIFYQSISGEEFEKTGRVTLIY